MSEQVIEIPHFCKKHVAHLLSVSDRTVQRWIDGGKVEAHQVGFTRAWYIALPEINRLRKLHAMPELTAQQAQDEIIHTY